MRVLVTGANGFVGRHVVPALAARGHKVRALVRPGARTEGSLPEGAERVFGDVTVPESLPAALSDVDAVVHLAGVTRASRASRYRRVNVEGTRALADACVGRGLRRLVYLSSLSAQGPSRPGAPHREAGCEAPIDAYGESKLAAERVLAERRGDLPITVLRPALLYGPGARAILELARLVQRRVAPVVPQMELSLLHVRDLAELVATVVGRDDAPFGPYFVSDGEPHTVEAVVAALERLVGVAPAMRLKLGRGLLSTLAPAAERLAAASGLGLGVARALREMGGESWGCVPELAARDFGFTPTVDLEAGLAAAVAWFRAQGLLAA